MDVFFLVIILLSELYKYLYSTISIYSFFCFMHLVYNKGVNTFSLAKTMNFFKRNMVKFSKK